MSENVLNAQKQCLKDILKNKLTRTERLIIVLYYYDEMTMAKIAKVLEMSEFELSQNHFSIIAGLKAEMKKIKSKFEPPESS